MGNVKFYDVLCDILMPSRDDIYFQGATLMINHWIYSYVMYLYFETNIRIRRLSKTENKIKQRKCILFFSSF